jgi:phage/plasmid primase-like uncharacterized protein
MKRVACPHCGQQFKTSDPDSGRFEFQGRASGKVIIKCGQCGNGMLVGLFGRPKAIDATSWEQHQIYMWDHFDSPEAQERFRAETSARLNAIDSSRPLEWP